jgi:hypothetical protein
MLIRQLFHIKQTDSVSSYIENFAELVDQLAAYSGSTDPQFYTQRFIDGLKDDVKSVVLLQRPTSWDTACVLARLQEEVSDPFKRRDTRRVDSSFQPRPAFKQPHPLPVPPLKLDKPSPVQSEDRRVVEATRAVTIDDKWAAVKAYRRAQGLCQRCAMKWSRDHKCAPTVQLHVLQELLDIFQLEDISSPDSPRPGSFSGEQLFMTLSVAALSGTPTPRTMSMLGSIQGHQINILVNSGSSHTFLNQQMAAKLQEAQSVPIPLQVQVADGNVLQCCQHFPAAVWSIQGCDFHADLKVLPLSSYDMILGLD